MFVVNESFGFGLMDGQKKLFEDNTFGSGKL